MNRCSGILMPVFSLPSPYGIGTLGKAAYDFADFLHAAGQTAAVAREDEADAPGVTHIRDRGLPAHENDVRVAQLPGNGFRHVETVSGARVAEDHIFAHVKHSLKF